ncbi:MAG: hypothetical protein H7Z14_20440, partial [Anaerolineae bacterium]|nr:hypothetical protein [Phycisphaerae bacterium]
MSKGERSFLRYIAARGWAHVLMLTFAMMFLFPFLWMIGTSLKTDEELTEGHTLPQWPSFRESSPYARSVPTIVKPADLSDEKWATILPKLQAVARQRVTTD